MKADGATRSRFISLQAMTRSSKSAWQAIVAAVELDSLARLEAGEPLGLLTVL